MVNLSVRKLSRNVYEGLRIRAAKYGVSMEEEARRILNQAITAPEKLSDVFLKHFGTENGVDLELLDQRKPHNPFG